MVVMEAMAEALVVLATPVGDIPNRLTSSFAMVTSSVDEETVIREMGAAVVALDRDRERMLRMKEAALEAAKGEFDLKNFRLRYRDLLMSPAS